MTSTTWAEVVLVVVLLAPLAAVVLSFAAAASHDDQRWIVGGCAIAAVGSGTLLVAGQHPHVSRLAPDDLALAAAAASALFGVGVRAAARAPAIAAAVTVVTCGLSVGAVGRPSTVGPVVGIAAALVLLATSSYADRWSSIAISGGIVVMAAGVHSGGHGGTAALVLGAVAMAAVASLAPRRPLVVLLPGALAIAVRFGPSLAGTGTARWVAILLAAAGAALAVAPVALPRLRAPGPGAAVIPWVGAATVGALAGTTPAARALAAGAVLALLLGGQLALVAAVPGAAVLGYALADGHGWVRLALAVLAAVTVVGVTRARPPREPVQLDVLDAVALALGAWLAIRPTAWTWAHVGDLRAYNDGTALAVASAAVAGALLSITRGRLDLTSVTTSLVNSDDDAPAAAGVRVGTLAVAVAMGIVAVALVRSARL